MGRRGCCAHMTARGAPPATSSHAAMREETPMSTRIAILDDYQGVARQYGGWDSVPEGREVHVFREHIAETATLLAALQGFAVIVAMQERTAFTEERRAVLPSLHM